MSGTSVDAIDECPAFVKHLLSSEQSITGLLLHKRKAPIRETEFTFAAIVRMYVFLKAMR